MDKQASPTHEKQDTSAEPKPETAQNSSSDAVTLLKNDHRIVEQLFTKFEAAKSNEDKQKIAKQICTELVVHTMLEEEIFYPACREKKVEDDLLDEAQVEHDGAKVLIRDLMKLPAHSPYYAKVTVLSEYIKHHVGEEEKSSGGIFSKAKKAGVDMDALGQRLRARKQELQQKAETEGFDPPQPRAVVPTPDFTQPNPQEKNAMDRHYERDRDESFTTPSGNLVVAGVTDTACAPDGRLPTISPG